MTETGPIHGAALETELKLRISDVESWPDRLMALGFREVTPLQSEQSTLWDRDRELQNQGCALRTRRHGPTFSVTWKGPRQAHPNLKIRPELETRVADGEALENILRALGYQSVLRMIKDRAVYRREPWVLCLDRTPFGCFLEIEGPEGGIDELRTALGLEGAEVEPRSYPTLYRLHGGT